MPSPGRLSPIRLFDAWRTSSEDRSALISGVLLVGLLLAWWQASQWYHARLLREARAEVNLEASLRAHTLSVAMNRRLARLEGLQAFVQAEASDPEMLEGNLETFVAGLASGAPAIRNIAVAPDGVVSFVYPLEGNESVLGYAPSLDPRPVVRADAERAITTAETVLTGPIELVQGGIGVIGRKAVFAGGDYWGLVNVVIDVEPILEESGVTAEYEGVAFALRDQNGAIFSGPPGLADMDPVLQLIQLPDGRWELLAAPSQGWQAAVSQQSLSFQAAGIVIVLLAFGWAYSNLDRQARLRLAVRRATVEIERVNEELRNDIRARQQAERELRESERLYRTLARHFPNGAVLLFDKDLRYRVADGSGLAEIGLSRETMEGRTVWEIFPPETSSVLEPWYRDALAGKPMVAEIPYENRVYEIHILPVRDKSGTIFAGMVMTQDITQRRRAEQELREREAQYRSIFQSATDGFFINEIDGEGRLVDFNPAAAHMHGYTVEEFRHIQPEEFIDPDSIHLFREYIESVREGKPFRTRAVDVRKDGSKIHVEVYGTSFIYQGRRHSLAVVRDISEVVASHQLLEARVEERTRELEGLLEISRNASSTLELDPLLGLLLDQLKGVVDYTTARVSTLEENELRVQAVRGQMPAEVALELRFPLSRKLDKEVVLGQRPVLIGDIYADEPWANAYREDAGPELKSTFANVRSFMGIPLIARGRVIGSLGLDHEEANFYGSHDLELATAFANQVASAVENARLFDEEQARRRQSEALLKSASFVASTLDLEQVLERILAQLRDVVHYDSASIQLFRPDRNAVEIVIGRGYADVSQVIGMVFPLTDEHPNKMVLDTGLPVNLEDAPGRYASFRGLSYADIHGWLGVPLAVQDRVIGMISLDRWYPGGFSEEECRLAMAFADLAALAIDNARLYQEAQKLAAVEERNRLARDLHDSVTQLIYSLSLFAEAARRALTSQEFKLAEDYLSKLRESARQSLKEMRLLVYQLRSSALAGQGLVEALQARLDAVEKRAGVETMLEVPGELALQAVDEQELYWIAQEALNNSLKHAGAGAVRVRLIQDAAGVELAVEDDGRGFDVHASNQGGIGLTSIRERAARLGGSVTIESEPGKGTSIRLCLPGAASARAEPDKTRQIHA